jgi:hypothetical protein
VINKLKNVKFLRLNDAGDILRWKSYASDKFLMSSLSIRVHGHLKEIKVECKFQILYGSRFNDEGIGGDLRKVLRDEYASTDTSS